MTPWRNGQILDITQYFEALIGQIKIKIPKMSQQQFKVFDVINLHLATPRVKQN